MGRISKIDEYDLREEVMELLMKGKGPSIIAAKLNAENTLPVPLNHVNIIKFRNALPKRVLAVIQENIDGFYLDPIKTAREELLEFKEKIMPAYMTAIKKGDIKAVRVYNKAFSDLFDRWAKIEKIIEPRGEMKVKYMQVNQQFNMVKERLSKVFNQLCPKCQRLVMETVEVITVEMEE